jgi:endoglucanase
LLNEPRGAMTAKAWNELIPLALAVIREHDPERPVIVGPARMNDIGALPELELPDDDRRWSHRRPLFIGEFGSYEQAGMAARRQWTRFVRLEAERLGLSWCYWDFGTDFGAFDPGRNAWREPLRDALLGD